MGSVGVAAEKGCQQAKLCRWDISQARIDSAPSHRFRGFGKAVFNLKDKSGLMAAGRPERESVIDASIDGWEDEEGYCAGGSFLFDGKITFRGVQSRSKWNLFARENRCARLIPSNWLVPYRITPSSFGSRIEAIRWIEGQNRIDKNALRGRVARIFQNPIQPDIQPVYVVSNAIRGQTYISIFYPWPLGRMKGTVGFFQGHPLQISNERKNSGEERDSIYAQKWREHIVRPALALIQVRHAFCLVF